MVYDRTHTRQLDELGGLAKVIPFACVTFVIGGAASMGFPGFSGFVAEYQILVGAFQMHPVLALAAGVSIPLTVAYILNANNKVFMERDQPAGAADMDMVMPMRPFASRSATDLAPGACGRHHPDGVAGDRRAVSVDHAQHDQGQRGSVPAGGAMTPISYFDIFKALSSEAMLVVTALAALTLDLASLRRAEPVVRRRTIGTVAIIGLLASVIPLWQQLGHPRTVLLGGTLAVDDLILLFKLVIVVLTLFTVLISMDYDVGATSANTLP